ncbi:hypothetical protein ACJRO7_029585 [Eucalyptus globulus]|uniref:Uncharacterized protein n=1 Tax=Eucalyptus globulus TaxID=34317 RepID=A0ABD3JBU8_EUCGL
MSPDAKDSDIRLNKLPFRSSDHSLPPNTESTENLPLDQMVTLFHSPMSLATPVEHLLSDITAEEGWPALCVISDVFFGRSTDIATASGSDQVLFGLR